MGKNWYFDNFRYVCICGFGFHLGTLLELVITRFVSPCAAFAKYVIFLEEINVYTVGLQISRGTAFETGTEMG
jgi:hypothetical protein